MDLKFNSWSIYQTDFIANSGQRGITDHGSDGSLLLVPGSRYLLVLWWPLASHVGSSVQGSPVICSDSDKKFIQLSRWLTTAANTVTPHRRYDCECQLKGETFCLCPCVCWVLCVMWICWLVACVRVFTFPRLASTTVCMTGALSAVTALSLQVSLSQSNCRNWLPQLSSISSGTLTAACYNCLLKIKHIFCLWIFPPMQEFTDIKIEWRVWDSWYLDIWICQ